MKNLSTDKIILGLVVLFTVAALVLIFAFSAKEQKNSSAITSYKATDSQRPKVKSESYFQDLGKIKVSQEKSAVFYLTNTGSKPLQLFNISSSCGCTVGQIEIETQKSPEFGMHSNSNWSALLEPGKEAKIHVIYRPYVMPVSGEVTRDVYLQTNDPENPKLTFTVKANVE